MKKPNHDDLPPLTYESENNILITGETFIPLVNKVMSDSIDFTLFRVTVDITAMEQLKITLNSFMRNIKACNFFLLENIQQVVSDIQSTPVLFYYFKTLDQYFILNAQSHTGLTYLQLVNKLMFMLAPTVPVNRDDSFLDDINFMNCKIDIEQVTEILNKNSLIFTLYWFSSAFPFSASFSVA